MIVKFTKPEIDYLKSESFLFPKLLSKIINSMPESLTLNISDEDADNLRDICAERLQEVGFDKDYNLTNRGRILESLIDKLFIG